MPEKLHELGIPPEDITPAVSIAVNGLLDHIEHLHKELRNATFQLEDIQSLVDFSVSPVLPNHKSLNKRLNWSIAMFHRHKEPICVSAFRIDNLQRIEENYGSEAANIVISRTAEAITNLLRDTDFFGRYARADFAAIMYFSDFLSCQQKAQQICAEVSAQTIRWNAGYINAKLEFGVHQITEADDAEKALLAATNAMYIQKQSPIGDLDLET